MRSHTFVASPEANAVLQVLVPGLRACLGERLVGVYLVGSLAVGDFDPAQSDIDFLAVTAAEVTEAQLAPLRAFHAGLFASGLPLADQVEGSYISRAALRVYDPDNARHPHIDRGEAVLEIRQHHTDWIVQRYSLRRYGRTLFGPPIETLVDPITPAELRAAVAELLRFWWEPMLADTTHLEQTGYQAYAVTTMCRTLYTLETGEIVSKPAAARWALERLDERYTSLIQRAVVYELVPADIPLTQALIRFAVERSRQP